MRLIAWFWNGSQTKKNRTENVMLYCTGNKYENFLIDSQVSLKTSAYYKQRVTPKVAPSPLCEID